MKREKERRKFPRIPVKVNLQLWKDGRIEKKAEGVIKNVNLEGLCVETDFRSAVGTDLVFSLNLSDELKFNIYGKIIWQKKIGDVFRLGAQFTKLDITDKPKLYRFILVTVLLDGKK